MKIAIVVDWLVVYAGAERVLEQMLACYPGADIFAVVDFIPDENNQRDFLLNKKVKTSFIQKLPWAKTKYRGYLPLMPLAIEQLDVTGYDIVISSSHAVAKGIITSPDQVHISYVHSPMRYAWDLQFQYLKESGLSAGKFNLKGWLARILLHKLRLWDLASAARVDHFIANSDYIARRINKIYRREASVIYPPVAVDKFEADSNFGQEKEEFYLAASRMVPYKKIPLIIKAFTQMPDKKLIVIGDGPEYNKAKLIADQASNITLMGYQNTQVLTDYLQRARAFIFAAIEDFGILPVEAQACGTPVIAYAKGGILETVKNIDILEKKASEKKQQAKPTGVFYYEQTVSAIIKAVEQFESVSINPQDCRDNAKNFSEELFRQQFKKIVESKQF